MTPPESSPPVHTPGPWRVDGDDIVERTGSLRGVYIGVPESAGGGRLAQTFANCLVTTDEECRANANLIAAAPELLQAAQEYMRTCVADEDVTLAFQAATNALRAAIARATGASA